MEKERKSVSRGKVILLILIAIVIGGTTIVFLWGMEADIGIGTYREGGGMSSTDPASKEVTASDPSSHYILYSVRTIHPAGLKKIQIYIDDKLIYEDRSFGGRNSAVGHLDICSSLKKDVQLLTGKHTIAIVAIDALGHVVTNNAVINIKESGSE